MVLLHQNQKTIAKDRSRFKVVNCGRRFGKTTLAVEIIKHKAYASPCRISYIAPTYQQARDIAWEMLKKELGGIIIKDNESRLELTIETQNKEQSLVILRGWESIETLRGQAFDLLIIDEIASMRNFWVNWQAVLRPTLTDTKGGVLFISTPKGFNHFYDLYNQELKDKDFKSFHFTSYDNPHIPKEEIDLARNQMTPERFVQEYMAEFSKTEGLVYKEFSRKEHLYNQLPEGNFQKIAGIDFGYTNPAAVLHIYTDGRKYYIEDEWYKQQRTETQIAEYVANSKFEAVYPDPESPSAIEELRRKNVNVREVAKDRDSIVSGIQKIRELLVQKRLFINQRCINTIYEFETYCYDDEKNERNANEKPIKQNDHALDALRYVVYMIEDLVIVKPEDIINIDQIRIERQNEFI